MSGLGLIAVLLFMCFLIVTGLIILFGAVKSHVIIIALRYLRGHMRSNMALLAAACVSTAVITGSLVAGDSLERSITDAAYDNLGEVDLAVISDGMFNASIAQRLSANSTLNEEIDAMAPIIHITGVAGNPDTGAKARHVNIIGFDNAFFEFGDMMDSDGTDISSPPGDNYIYLNRALAEEVAAGPGDNVEILLSDPGSLLEAVFLNDQGSTNFRVQLGVQAIVDNVGLGRFQLSANRDAPFNVYLSLSTMQKVLGVSDSVNTILISNRGDVRGGVESCSRVVPILERALDSAVGYRDAGLSLVQNSDLGYLKLGSEDVLFPYDFYDVIQGSSGLPELDSASPVLTYFWNSLEHDGSSVPYSTITAFDSELDEPMGRFTLNGTPQQVTGALEPSEIIINQFTAVRLGAQVGDTVAMNYSVLDDFYNIRYVTADFTVKYIVDMQGKAADGMLMPAFPGIQGRLSVLDWEPPFPLDLSQITDDDEEYWLDHGGTPKAFIQLERGMASWGTDIGNITQVRMRPTAGTGLGELETAIARLLDDFTVRKHASISISSVKLDALASAEGIELFTEMFLAFSASCIAASAVLIMLLTTLRLDSRMTEIGILRALGFRKGTIVHIMLVEGTIILVAGGALGCLFGFTFGYFLILGMNTFWSSIVEGTHVSFYISSYSLIAGFASGAIISILTLGAALGYLGRLSVIRVMSRLPSAREKGGSVMTSAVLLVLGVGMSVSLALSGTAPDSDMGLPVVGFAMLTLILAARQYTVQIKGRHADHVLGAATIICTVILTVLFMDSGPTVILFFMSGFLLLSGLLMLFYHGLMRHEWRGESRPSRRWLLSFSMRNAARRPKRSMFTMFLFSFTLFILTSLTINIQGVVYDVERAVNENGGGYDIMGDSVNPVFADLSDENSRLEGGIDSDIFDELEIHQFKTRGDVGGTCSNLNRAASPRIIAAGESFFSDNTFTFVSHDEIPAGADNPWWLLSESRMPAEVPAIGDYNTVVWILGLDLGSTVTIEDGEGATVSLVIVGIIDNSILQGSLVIWEGYFDAMFPTHPGYDLFLFRSQSSDLKSQIIEMEAALDRYGFDGYTVESRVVENILVENTYISVFQVILVFGLAIGTLGFGIVVSRNIMERQRETGILRALGLKRKAVVRSLIMENGYILLSAMAIGTVSGVAASSIYLVKINTEFLSWPWLSIAVILVSSFVVAMGSAAMPIMRSSGMTVAEATRRYE